MRHTLLLAFFILGATLLKAQSGKPALIVYPNPATEFIAVNDATDATSLIVIFNVTGRKQREFDYQRGEQYNICDLPKGIYLIQLLDKSGRTLTTQKIEKR